MSERRPRIVCDLAERRSTIPALLAELGAVVTEQRLTAGDYLLPGDVAVERKGRDFGDSLLSGRLDAQLARLSAAHGQAVLLLEGDEWRGDRRLRTPMLVRLYARICDDPSLNLLYSPSPRSSARILFGLAGRAAGGTIVPTPVVEAHVRRPLDLLLALPGVGPAGARKLAAHFDSFAELAAASESALRSVVGPRRGERMYRILNDAFSQPRSR